MFKNKIMKVLALLMVLNILIIPLTSFSPQNQNKYTVQASEGLVDIRFFNAVITMLGITAAGLATMSPNFSIPEVDMIELKDQFAQTLEADAVKKAAWMSAQTDYLSGGIAKTMGAVELAKIGISDIYIQFKNYLLLHFNNSIPSSGVFADGYELTYEFSYEGYNIYSTTQNKPSASFTANRTWFRKTYTGQNYQSWETPRTSIEAQYHPTLFYYYLVDNNNNIMNNGVFIMRMFSGLQLTYLDIYNYSSNDSSVKLIIDNLALNYCNTVGINDYVKYTTIENIFPIGSINYNDVGTIINATDESINIIPTIPWIDNTVPIGTIVTPAISAPYAGTVPIDVPTTAPIDPPIEEPDTPVIDIIAGTVAAILAGLSPIAGFLEYILAGQVTLTDTIEAGITGVIDGIGDIAGTLTEGITSSLTDIQTNIGTLLEPPSSSINWEPIKNIPAVLFSGFPFSLPYDFYKIISFMGGSAREAPVFSFTIPLSSIGQQDVTKEIDMTPFDQIAGYVRIAELIAFSIAVMLKTKSLIWG